MQHVIIAPTVEMGNELKRSLGLQDWHVTTVRSLKAGDLRGIWPAPTHYLVMDEWGYSNGWDVWAQAKEYLPATESRHVWILTGTKLK